MMKNGAYFPYMLIGLLLISVGSNVYLLVRATNDPSFAVEPDYYEKAVEWDALQEAKAASDRLGWKAEVDATRDEIIVRLEDAAGIPVEGAVVHVVAFHNARAGDRRRAQLAEEGQGVYRMNGPFERPGLWEMRISAVRDEDHFSLVRKEDLR